MVDRTINVMKKLQQNAASIPINLGEGYHGYLVLILSDKQLKNILGTIPFVKPVDSGVFITAVTTNAVIAIKNAQWDDEFLLYNECQLLESMLKHYFFSTFESEYFDGIRTSISNAVERPISEVIQYLYDEYGKMILE